MAKKTAVNRILAVIQQEGAKNNPSELLLGEVISQNPLSIRVGELPLTREDLLVNKFLLEYDRQFTINTCSANGTLSGVAGGIATCGFDNKKIIFHNVLKEGSTVVLYPVMDNQKYLVLCEVI